jgi:TPR repeat protein
MSLIKSNKLTVAMSIALLAAGAGMLGVANRAESASEPTELIARAESGDVNAQRELGEIYLSGQGVKRNTIDGVRFLQLAAAANDPTAHYLLGRYFESEPKVGAEQRQQANQHYQRAALLGHTSAQARYAQIMLSYADSPGLPSADAAIYRQQAVMLLEHAAKSGNAMAQLVLADLKAGGEVVPLDNVGAMNLYRQASTNGEPLGAWRLAQRASRLPPGHAGAFEVVRYTKEAAQGGVPEAIHDLALRFENGRGVPRNIEAAKRWIEEAVKAGVPGAPQDALRIIAAYNNDRQKTQIDAANQRLAAIETKANEARSKLDTTASELAQRKVEFEQISNQLTEAAIENSELKAENDRLASEIRRYKLDDRKQLDEIARLSKQLDDTKAELVAANVEVERQRAIVAAIRQGSPGLLDASRLAEATKSSAKPAAAAPRTIPVVPAVAPVASQTEVVADPRELNKQGLAALRAGRNQEAAELLQQAAAAGDPIAMNNMGLLFTRGLGVNKDPHRAIELFSEAVEKGNAAAAGNLGYIYQHGADGVPANRELAISWYERGMAMGNRASAEQLMVLRQGLASNS